MKPLCTGRPRALAKQVNEYNPPRTEEEADRLPFVYADAMAFGMGSCCLQVPRVARGSGLFPWRRLHSTKALLGKKVQDGVGTRNMHRVEARIAEPSAGSAHGSLRLCLRCAFSWFLFFLEPYPVLRPRR